MSVSRGKVLRLGLLELRKNLFAPRLPQSAGRDFRLLLLVFAALSVVLVFGAAMREQGSYRIDQTLLGALDETALPVRVKSDYRRRTYAIDAHALEAFELRESPELAAPGLSAELHPWRDLDLGTGLIRLPGASEFAAGEEGLQARAIPIADPLWTWALARNAAIEAPKPFARIVIASETQFAQKWDAAAYREALESDPRLGSLRRFLPQNGALPERLILDVEERIGIGGSIIPRRSLQDFTVLWVKGLPLAGDIGLVLPLSTVELTMASIARSASSAPEGEGEPVQRVVRFEAENDGAVPAPALLSFAALADCLGPDIYRPGGEADYLDRIEPKAPLALEHVRLCVQKSGLGPELLETGGAYQGAMSAVLTAPIGESFGYVGPGRMETPCSVLGEQDFSTDLQMAKLFGREAYCPKLEKDPGRGILYLIDPYFDATLYIGRDVALPEALAGLTAWRLPGFGGEDPLPVLAVDPAYAKALERTDILRTITKVFGGPVGVILALLLAYLIFSKISVILSHRRREYGFWALHGCTPNSLGLMAMSQVSACAFMGGTVGIAIGVLAMRAMNFYLWQGINRDQAYATLGFDAPALLGPPGPFALLGLLIILTAGGAILTAGALWFQGLLSRKRLSPMEVISGRNRDG